LSKRLVEQASGGGRLLTNSPILLVLFAALLWSTGGLLIKATSLNAFELSFYRSLLAALTVAFFTRREGFKLNGIAVLTSVLYAALLLLFVVATKLTTAANAIFLQYTAPIYVLLLEPIFYKERFRLGDLLTVAICIAGMSLFFVGKLRPEDVSGNLAALASGLCFAFYFLLLRHPRAQRVNRAASVIYGNLLVVLLTAPVGLAAFSRVTALDAVSIAFLGIFQIGVAYTLFTLGMARGVRSLDASIIGYIEPVLNPVWVFLVLGERPSEWALVGGCIIVAAVVAHTIRGARITKAKGKSEKAIAK
jgi:drug/metabolite transporter (DMT)-like permease